MNTQISQVGVISADGTTAMELAVGGMPNA